MRTRLLLLLAVLPVLAIAADNRHVIEDGTTGTVSNTTNPTQVFGGQGSTTLRAHTCAANSCTRAVPTTSIEGMKLNEVSAYRVYAMVDSGTFTGTGTLELYLWDPDAAGGTWLFMGDKSLSLAKAAGKSAYAWPVERNSARNADMRIVYRSNAVGTSAAAPTLTVGIRGCITTAPTGCGAP